ncbi:hypothetical protein K661_02401 [Piscirickettsia salmonis LF-89 = ATCC VR-1361]|nr:hypothetical protein K661_02401 [Piscirickettsia salmonis LF-89 = ATCC VR-1361]
MQIVKRGDLPLSEKLNQIKEIRSSAMTGYQSSFLFFIKTQHSTNQFISKFVCD